MGGGQLNWLFFLSVLHLVYEVYNGDSNSITMEMGNGGNVSTGVFLSPKGCRGEAV